MGGARPGVTRLERRLARRLHRAIDQRITPGAALAFGSAQGVTLQLTAGWLTYDRTEPVTADVLWDLASVTKVIVGASLAGLALERGGFTLDTTVASVHPAYGGDRWRRTTVGHLLNHAAGQPAWLPFYEEGLDRDAVRDRIAALPPEAEPGTASRYSDLDFLVLWDVLEGAFGPLEEAAFREIFEPLGMADSCFCPSSLGLAARCAPTEDCAWRGRVVQGEVHDENSAQLGGMTPHAGLFSTVSDVGMFMTSMLQALDGRSAWMRSETARLLVTRRGPPQGSFALGWATGTGEPGGLTPAGRRLSAHSFGHRGFTGTSVVADPEAGCWLVVLTNRVHPSRMRGGARELSDELADLVARG